MPPSLPVPRTASCLSVSFRVIVETLLRRKRRGSTRDWKDWPRKTVSVGAQAVRRETPRRWKEWDNASRMLSSTNKRTSISPEGSLPGEADPTGFGQRRRDAFAVVLETGIEWLPAAERR